MTLYEFNTLDVSEQVETVWVKGVLIGERTEDHYTVYLFQIDGFYVEMFHNEERNEFTRYRSFRSTAFLTPYLAGIDIAELVL